MIHEEMINLVLERINRLEREYVFDGIGRRRGTEEETYARARRNTVAEIVEAFNEILKKHGENKIEKHPAEIRIDEWSYGGVIGK